MTGQVPTLNLTDFTAGDASTQRAFERALEAGLKRYGFIILEGHNVGLDMLDRAYALSSALFARPEAEKRLYAGSLRGYTPFGTEHAKNTSLPDLKEFWQIGREVAAAEANALDPANVWPEHWPEFRAVFNALFTALEETGRILLRALAPALKLPRNYFDPIVTGGPSLLRLLHYPPVPAGAPPGAVRAAAHEDINFLTILVAAKGAGLELLDHDGSWLAVETAPRNLIVDTGDMMARLTNGVIPATTHRVVNPAGPNVSRYSMPFFLHPKNDTSLAALPSCLGDGAKFPPITAGNFLAERLREIGLAKQKTESP